MLQDGLNFQIQLLTVSLSADNCSFFRCITINREQKWSFNKGIVIEVIPVRLFL